MKYKVLVATALAALAIPAAAEAQPVDSLSGPFAATNTSVVLGVGGVQFGPYANGGFAGGSLYYSGFNGQQFGAINQLSFTVAHSSADNSPLAAPYLRVFLDTDENGIEDSDVIFDATHCATVIPLEDQQVRYEIVPSDVRFNDDGCDGIAPDQQEFALVQADQRESIVTGMYVTQGFAGGHEISALMTELSVNGQAFRFDQRTPGAPAVAPPATIVNTPTVTRIVNQPLPPQGLACTGNTLRTIHAPRRRGATFLSATARLNGVLLPVDGRNITVDLRNQTAGLFKVTIRSRYRSHRTHRVFRRTTTRRLSVLCH